MRDPLAGVPVLDHHHERIGVGARVAGELGGGVGQFRVDREQVAVGQREDHRRVGDDVLQPVAGDQPELVVADQRVRLQHNMRRRARVVMPAGKGELLGHGVAADHVATFEHRDGQTGLGQIRRAHERIVSAAHHNNIAGWSHFRPSVETSLLLR